MLIDGIHVPVAEPFYRDGALYLRKLEHNVRRYSLSPVSGLVILPPGGEAMGLSDAEARDVLAAAGDTAAKEKVLVAGIQRDSVLGAVEVAKWAHEARFDAILLSAPRNWQSLVGEQSPSALLLFFRAVADQCELPVFLWSASEAGAYELSVEEIAQLSQHPNIAGIYCANLTVDKYKQISEATAIYRRDVEVTTVFAPVTRRMKIQETAGAATFVSADALGGGAALATVQPRAVMKTRMKTVGFQIMAAGRVDGLVPLLEAGLQGSMPRLATCAPQAVYEAFAAFKDGDPALAREKAQRLEAADALVTKLGVAAVKYGCDLNGYYGGIPRLPRMPLTSEDRSCTEIALCELKN